MQRKTILLTLACAAAALAAPSAMAQGVAVDVPVPPALDVVDGAAGRVTDLPGVAVAVDVDVQIAPEAGVAAAPVSIATRSGATSFSQQAADAAPVVVGSAAVLVLLGAALRAAATGLLGGLPLFSRIERGALLDNPVRARVHDLVAQEPGLSLSDVGARAGVAWGTAVHHLRRLETHGLVVSVRQHGHRRFFLANTPAAAQRSAMAVVMHPTARRIAEFVTQRPGNDQTAICKALGLNNPAASKHLTQFEARGLVLSERSGRSRHYHPTSGMHSALLLLEPRESPGITGFADRHGSGAPALVPLIAAAMPGVA